MSFVLLKIIRSGWFLNRVAIEATESVSVERVRFRLNSLHMSWFIGEHNDLIFAKGDRVSIYASKKIEEGSIMTVGEVSKAVSAHCWQWLASREV